jgi:hypothetical protein
VTAAPERRKVATETAAPVPQPQPPVRVIETPAAPVPQPRIETPNPAPVHESPEKQIGTFMQQLVAAYQARDVAFFRDHFLHFDDQLANAVRRSPSERVELQISRIDVHDPQHANVHVKRTDWFPDPSLPPATQALVYHLERSNGRWLVASMTRQ